jgi:hypothetical protein
VIVKPAVKNQVNDRGEKGVLNGTPFLFIDIRQLPHASLLFAWLRDRLDTALGAGCVRLCCHYNEFMRYTIRNVPDSLDKALRLIARERGKSLNEVAIEVLAKGAGITLQRCRQRDLGDVAGTWRNDPAFDSALAEQDTVDNEISR